MEYLIKTFTEEDEIVLDFTCGSGSTGVACDNLKRGFIGIDSGFCEKEIVINDIKLKGKPWVEISKLRIYGKI